MSLSVLSKADAVELSNVPTYVADAKEFMEVNATEDDLKAFNKEYNWCLFFLVLEEIELVMSTMRWYEIDLLNAEWQSFHLLRTITIGYNDLKSGLFYYMW